MNWKNSILHLKARTGMQTDKALYARASINPSAFTAIKRGTATFKTVEKLCLAWDVKVSEFITWGE